MTIRFCCVIGIVVLLETSVLADTQVDRLYRMGDDASETAASNGGTVALTFDSIGTVFSDGDLQDLAATGTPTYVDISSDRPLPADASNVFAISFNGVDTYLAGDPLNLPSTSAANVNASSPILGNYDGLVDRGYQFWAKPDASGIGNYQQVVSDGGRHAVNVNGDGEWVAVYNGSYVTSGILASTTEWTHLMQVRPSYETGSIMYINGLAAVTQSGGYASSASGYLTVGSNAEGTGGYYAGLVDELEMFVLGDNGIISSEFNYATDNDYFTEVFLPSASSPGYSAGEAWIVGDANFDGTVNDDDVNAFLDGWLSSNEDRVTGNGGAAGDYLSIGTGDFDLDGVTDRDDWFILRQAYLAATGSELSLPISVPEPASACILGIALGGLALWRKNSAKWSIAALFLALLAMTGSTASAQVTITHDGQNDPCNVFFTNVTPLSSYTTFFEGDASNVAQGRGSSFFAPDTGDANTGWSLDEITVRWDDNGNRYPASDLGVRLTIVQWPTTDPADFSTSPTDGQLPGTIIYQQTGTLPTLTPQTDLVDGDRLRLTLDSTVFLQQNVPYAFLVDFDPTTGTKDNESVRLEITNSSGVVPGHLWAVTQDAATGEVLTSGANTGQDLAFYLGGTATAGTTVLPILTIDRDSGNMTLRNDTAEDYSMVSYDFLATTIGRFDQAGWSTIESQGLDTDDTWVKFTAPESVSDLAEGTFGEYTLVSGGEINFGNAWQKSPVEDVVLTIQDIDGNDISVVVEYTGNGGNAFALGDFDVNGTVDALDWAILRDNLLADVSSLETFDAYFQGDLNADGVVNVFDFAEFRTSFELENGAGSFAQMVSSVPEPSSLLLMAAASCVALIGRRSARLRAGVALLLALVAGAIAAPSAQAQNLITNGEFVITYSGTIPSEWRTRPQDKDQSGGVAPGSDSAPITWTNGATATGLPVGEVITLPGWGAVNNVGQGATLNHLSNEYPSSQSDGDDLNAVALIRYNDDAYYTQTIPAASLMPNTTYTLSAGLGGRGQTDDTWVSNLRDAALIGLFAGGNEVASVDFSVVDSKPLDSADPLDNFSVIYTTGSVVTDLEVRLGSRDAGIGGNAQLFGFDNVEFFAGVVQDPLKLNLVVDMTNGHVRIDGATENDLSINYYQISSSNSLLLEGTWNSLQDQDIEGNGQSTDGNGWEEAGQSSGNGIAEAYLQGDSLIGMGSSFANLGSIFDYEAGFSPVGDLTFSYRLADGIIEYGNISVGTVTPPTNIVGDYNGDGVVNLADYTVWRDNLGGNASTAFATDTRDPANTGPIGVSDYATWKSNFGASASSASAAQQAVPEPSAIVLISLFCGLCAVERRRASGK
ncbi:PEP-CTERM sorting domain-containing protein [Aeoliella mucimassa]|uniref:PEP-CTERM sorting domain-containing protein n=1 Tax=Aeoliella mucimassa TaxID=2527972 RepID=UPI001E46E193|nr:PEP-CTERM sorting domain-containing protein [Aeoliella mucimassa]